MGIAFSETRSASECVHWLQCVFCAEINSFSHLPVEIWATTISRLNLFPLGLTTSGACASCKCNLTTEICRLEIVYHAPCSILGWLIAHILFCSISCFDQLLNDFLLVIFAECWRESHSRVLFLHPSLPVSRTCKHCKITLPPVHGALGSLKLLGSASFLSCR